MRATIVLIVTWALLSACDPEGRKECVWVLEPEPSRLGTTEGEYIPVCARNRKTMKQDCRLQAPLDFAKAAYGRKFRYIDLKIVNPGNPRTISSIEYCE